MNIPNIKSPRLISLDVFRGITVALMIIVNSPGNNSPYALLDHSAWNGCTLADLVFPFFIFIVGVSVACYLTKEKEKNITFKQLFPKILKRTVILFLLGLFLNAFPYHFEFATIRVFGVLQRIAICYFFSSILFLTTKISTQAIIMISLIIIYWLLMILVSVPGFGVNNLSPEGNISAYIDRLIFSSNHLYGKVFDPEGLLSTIPSVSTALLGNLTGAWLLSSYSKRLKIYGLTSAGILALISGWLWGLSLPINKALWSSSYVLWTGGFALIILAGCFWLNDVKKYKSWSKPFEFFGLNALLAYFLHVFFLKIQAMILISKIDGSKENLRLAITENLFNFTSIENAALLYSFSYLLLWLILIYLYSNRKARKSKL